MVSGKKFVDTIAALVRDEGVTTYDTNVLNRIREMDWKEINYYISLCSSNPSCGNCEKGDMDEEECQRCKTHEYCYFLPMKFADKKREEEAKEEIKKMLR